MDDIYEVGRDEYVGLVSTMRTDCFDMEKEHLEQCTIIKLVNKKTGQLMTKRIIQDDGNEQYFIYELPQADEKNPPKPIRRITLETKEEVQEFFDALNQLRSKKDG